VPGKDGLPVHKHGWQAMLRSMPVRVLGGRYYVVSAGEVLCVLPAYACGVMQAGRSWCITPCLLGIAKTVSTMLTPCAGTMRSSSTIAGMPSGACSRFVGGGARWLWHQLLYVCRGPSPSPAVLLLGMGRLVILMRMHMVHGCLR
jgi:hypothetical protein